MYYTTISENIMILTLKLKLSDDQDIFNTISCYTNALNYVSQSAFSKYKKVTNNLKLHKEYYQTIRSNYNLPSQMACSVFRDVSAKYKANKKKKLSSAISFKETHINYVYNKDFSFKNNILKISTINGRKQYNINLCDYYKNFILKSTEFNGSTLIKTKKNELYFCLCITIPENTLLEKGNTMGIDIGLSKFAVCSVNSGKTLVINGDQIKNKKAIYQKIRSRLQHKGTRSSKRVLKSLSGRENRFMRDTNFCIVKKIINFAKENNVSNIGIEDLTGIRTTKLRKDQRRAINSWAFYQFRFILEYKAKLEGIAVSVFSPAYTSQACSKCGYTDKSNRTTQKQFKCKSCDYTSNADINASHNIEFLTRLLRSNLIDRASINKPDESGIKFFSNLRHNFQIQTNDL